MTPSWRQGSVALRRSVLCGPLHCLGGHSVRGFWVGIVSALTDGAVVVCMRLSYSDAPVGL